MAGTDFSVQLSTVGSSVVISPKGELDIATSPAVREAVGGRGGPMVLDLREVEFMDTSGLHLLLELRRRCEDAGAPFAVVRGAQVQRLLDIAGMTPYLRLLDEPQDAASHEPPAAG